MKYDTGSLLAFDNRGEIIGIITERDLVRAMTEFGTQTGDRCVGEIMTRSVVTCGLDDDVVATFDLMNKMGFHHMPVVAEKKAIAALSIHEFDYACKQLKFRAGTDKLTGLPNPEKIHGNNLGMNSAGTIAITSQFCVAMVDIDELQQINDTYGHYCGDQVLISLASVLKIGSACLRYSGSLGR